MSGIHDGHRQRIKEQFINNGLQSFQPHQILEFLLFYSVPRSDTNEIAHNLLLKFGDLPSVFNAPYEELTKVEGITENSAVLIKMIPQLLSVYSVESNKTHPLDSIDVITKYFNSIYLGVLTEQLRICCLDDKLNIVNSQVVEDGIVSAVPVNVRKIVELIYKSNCTFVILSHNHPNGMPVPSDADIEATRKLFTVFSQVGITLLDHIIVADGKICSMKYTGYFDFER